MAFSIAEERIQSRDSGAMTTLVCRDDLGLANEDGSVRPNV